MIRGRKGYLPQKGVDQWNHSYLFFFKKKLETWHGVSKN